MPSGTFGLTSTAFTAGGAIPKRFTCDGDDASPDLWWTDAPTETASLALIVDDIDAHEFTHWLVYNMDPVAAGGLAEAIAATPDAPPQGLNDFGKIGYGGPCPPSGTHRYRFTLYALDQMLPIVTPPHAADLRQALEGHVLAMAELTATYTRG